MKAGYAPAPPVWLLNDELKTVGLTVGTAANKMRIKRKQLANIVYKNAPITPIVALAIEQHIGGKAEIWLAMQRSYDLWKLRQSQIVHNDSDDNEHIAFEVTKTTFMTL